MFLLRIVDYDKRTDPEMIYWLRLTHHVVTKNINTPRLTLKLENQNPRIGLFLKETAFLATAAPDFSERSWEGCNVIKSLQIRTETVRDLFLKKMSSCLHRSFKGSCMP